MPMSSAASDTPAPRASPWTALTIILASVCVLVGGVLGGWYFASSLDTSPPFRLTALASRPRAPDFHLVDSDNWPRTLADFRGKIVLIFFGYTHCPEACPTELFKLAQVMRRLGEARSRVQVLLITLDPERDTPQLLKGYVGAFDPGFIGLTGTPAQVDKVATDYHVVYYKEKYGAEYLIDHSTYTYIIDGKGDQRLLARMDASVDDLASDLKRLANTQ